MDGPKRVPGSEILAWCQISGIRLARWELGAVRRLDRAWLQIATAKSDD
jgi:hypothetical protein